MSTLFLGILFIIAFSLPPVAQSASTRPQKKEKFGDSLKRLKWNKTKQAAEDPTEADRRMGVGSGITDSLKVETNLVVLDLLVTDQGGSPAVASLNKDDFVITEDGVRQQPVMLSLGDAPGAARSIILIMDFSSSLSRYLNASVEAAKSLVSRLGPNDEIAIVNDEVELMVDYTKDKKRLKSALDSLKKRERKNGSRQLSALFASLRELTGKRPGRTIMILQSDGDEIMNLRDQDRSGDEDRPYQFGLSDIKTAILGSRATLYTLITSPPLLGISQEEAQLRFGRLVNNAYQPGRSSDEDHYARVVAPLRIRAQESLLSVTDLSGGWADYLETPEGAERLYTRILEDINQRYILSYYPTNDTRDGRARTVRIEVRGHPEYRVQGRKTYSLQPQ